jgi:hypothetical protein
MLDWNSCPETKENRLKPPLKPVESRVGAPAIGAVQEQVRLSRSQIRRSRRSAEEERTGVRLDPPEAD